MGVGGQREYGKKSQNSLAELLSPVGAELSEFVIILNSRAAIQSFMSAGSINLGGNMSIAVGPVGRNAEASGSLTKLATMYSYSRTRGLFGGASLEGSVIFERAEANEKAYAGYLDDDVRGVTARMLLSGQVDPPPWAGKLIQTLEQKLGRPFDHNWIDDQPSDFEERRNQEYYFGSENASRSSDGPKSSPKDTLGKGRLRGYSLGSFGRSKSSSGSASPAGPSFKRDRGNSSASSPGARRYRDEYDVGNTDRSPERSQERDEVIDAYNGSDQDANEDPNSPSSTSSSRSQRFLNFKKRPVLSSRKSTSAAAEMRSSPLSGRSRSGSKVSRRSIWEWPDTIEQNEDKHLDREQHSSSNSSSDSEPEGGRSELQIDTRVNGKNSPKYSSARIDRDRYTSPTTSPFADRFSPTVDKHFESNNHKNKSRFRGNDYDDQHPADNGGPSQYPQEKKKKPSLLESAANALARPLTRRSATAPVVRRVYNSDDQDASDGDDHFASRYKIFDDERDNGFAERNSVGHTAGGQSADSSDTEEGNEHGQIAIHRNPFEDVSTSAVNGSRKSNSEHNNGNSNGGGGSRFFTKQDSRDLLSTLDEDEPLASSSFSSLEQPRHRMDALYSKDNHDTRSIRSFDSNTEFTFGGKAHKVIEMVTNDLNGKESKFGYSQQKKEMRMATYDFQGGDVSLKMGLEALSQVNQGPWLMSLNDFDSPAIFHSGPVTL